MEKREFEREEVHKATHMIINGRIASADVKDLSFSGAGLEIIDKDGYLVSQRDLGKRTAFTIQKSSGEQEPRFGEIVRYEKHDSIAFIGIQFK